MSDTSLPEKVFKKTGRGLVSESRCVFLVVKQPISRKKLGDHQSWHLVCLGESSILKKSL